MSLRLRTVCITALALSLVSARPGAAQEAKHRTRAILGANAAFAGLAAGLSAALDDRPFWPAFAKGAVGGSIMFAGKRITASDTEAMGLVGRQVSALGASIARNAALGAPVLDTLIVPVGPVRLAWSTSGGNVPGVRVDAEAVAWIGYGLTNDRYTLDAGRSLAAGTVVFMTDEVIAHQRGEGYVTGLTGGGVIFLSEAEVTLGDRNREHELVHVDQTDYLKIAFGVPIERWLLTRAGWDESAFFRHVDPGVAHYPLQGLLRTWLEAEADWFEHRSR